MPVNLRLIPPEAASQIVLSAEQQTALAEKRGHHLLLGAAGTGRTTVLLQAAIAAATDWSVERTWVIAANRTNAESLRGKLVELNPAKTPKVMTVSALAYGLLRTDSFIKSAGEIQLTMLTGPQQEARIRSLISDHAELWPANWQQAIKTKVFASDLRRFLDVSRHNAASVELAKSVEKFAELLFSEIESHHELTYVDANYEVANLLSKQELSLGKIRLPDAVLVDDLHDFDPSQLEFLIQLLTQVSYSFSTSNSDAAVLGFRGVGIGITKTFRDQLEPAVHLLRTVYRHGAQIGELARNFLPSQFAPDLNTDEITAIRKPSYINGDAGEVSYQVSVSTAIRDQLIVDQIMHARVEQGLEFSQLAIIGRSFLTLSNLRRALAEAGIPVEYAPDNVPLAQDPAVAQLITALCLATNPLDPIPITQLIQFARSEIVGMNAADLRYSAQQLRKLDLFGPTDEVVATAIVSPALLSQLPFDPRLQPIKRASAILHSVISKARLNATIGEVLWSIWQAEVEPQIASQIGYDRDENWKNWPTRLVQQSAQLSALGRNADRDLDAVLAFFDAADRADRNYQGSISIREFIDEVSAQDAASEVLVKRAKVGVAVLTAHRARGREWEKVFLVDLQEGVWPAANVRESLIAPRDSDQQRARLAEERRLAAAAVATAKQQLIIAVVDSKVDQGSAPSGILAEVELPTAISAAPPSVLTARGLIAQLRAVTTDENATAELKAAATSRLGYLASLTDSRFAPARPDSWWFLPERTHSDKPIINPDLPPTVSGSMLESITKCPTQWFFERRLGIKDQPIANTVIGIAIHSVAEKIINQKLDLDTAYQELENLWPEQVFEAPWQSRLQFGEARAMVAAIHRWLVNSDATAVGTEVSFKVLHADLGVVLVGKIDLLAENNSGELEISDFKTGAAKPTQAELAKHSQLGIYQLAAEIDQSINPKQLPVSAKLVQIRLRNSKDQVVEQQAPPFTEPQWLIDQISIAKTRLESEDLPAKPGQQCRNCRVRTVCPAVPEGDQVTS